MKLKQEKFAHTQPLCTIGSYFVRKTFYYYITTGDRKWLA